MFSISLSNQKIEGSLEDYAWIIAAMIKLGKVSKESYYFQLAKQWLDFTTDIFWNDQKNFVSFSKFLSIQTKIRNTR